MFGYPGVIADIFVSFSHPGTFEVIEEREAGNRE